MDLVEIARALPSTISHMVPDTLVTLTLTKGACRVEDGDLRVEYDTAVRGAPLKAVCVVMGTHPDLDAMGLRGAVADVVSKLLRAIRRDAEALICRRA